MLNHRGAHVEQAASHATEHKEELLLPVIRAGDGPCATGVIEKRCEKGLHFFTTSHTQIANSKSSMRPRFMPNTTECCIDSAPSTPSTLHVDFLRCLKL
eukprot:5739071-Amphidinium_carterae.1